MAKTRLSDAEFMRELQKLHHSQEADVEPSIMCRQCVIEALLAHRRVRLNRLSDEDLCQRYDYTFGEPVQIITTS